MSFIKPILFKVKKIIHIHLYIEKYVEKAKTLSITGERSESKKNPNKQLGFAP